MTQNYGWISLHRKLQNSKVWHLDTFSRGQAWVDLILLANHQDGIVVKHDKIIPIKRGQVGHSILDLSLRWRWSRTKVNTFLNLLQNMNQISVKTVQRVTTIISITNYDKFQQKNNEKTTRKQREDINNNVNNVNKKEVGPVQLKNGSFYLIPKQDIERWKNTYTNIDIIMTLKEIVEWNHNNPSKRKTLSGISKHITSWLSRENKKAWQILKQSKAEASPMPKYITEVVKERGF